MKPLRKLTFALLLSLTTAAGFSQNAINVKQRIFDGSPSSVNCPASEFSNAFSAVEGQHITLFFSDHLKFSGTVISNIVKYSNLQSVTIRSDDAESTIFHLSKQINEDNSISYVGRIMNSGAADGYEIRKDETGRYKFEKVNAEKILQVCNL